MLRVLAVLVCAAGLATTQQVDWQPLFDGKSLAGWRETPFTGKGPVKVEGGSLVLGYGSPMTGVTRAGEALPKTNYELRYEAARKGGGDFFATVTFPVADSHCTLVTGGWGGDIVGLSSIDGWDASENETRQYFTFETGRWYAIRVRVTPDRISAWIDEQRVVDVGIEGRTIGLRHGETKLMAPLGFASYNTMGVIRKIEYRVIR
ncbi:MAG: DUF1080 domain-containing protein [Bryobacteraceae bacterium]|nr:DUF1080 domain-containing protein [Bryobacteraceae bacterium]